LLCDYGQSGHQLLVFTCHEHLARLFKSLRVDVRNLPGSSGFDLEETPPLSAARRPRKRKPPPDERPHRVVAASLDDEPPEPGPDREDAGEAPAALEHLAPWEEDDEGAVDVLRDENEEGAEAA